MKTIYYYQTFVGLQELCSHPQDIDVIIISSIHFDQCKDGTKQIYLNDHKPDDKKFNDLWWESKLLYQQGVTFMLMIGGAGGAYRELFSDFKTYYPQLKNLLEKQNHIGGVDLDIEESVDINQVKMLIRLLKQDFPNFKISMAPISSSMINDTPGMGGFSYKELYKSYEETLIDWYNVQCYDSFSFDTYQSIIKNGYPCEKIVMGMESGQFTKQNFYIAINEVNKILDVYPKMAGVYDWEYLDAPPVDKDPSQWARKMKNVDQLYWDKLG
jgi:hypothetical protein